MLLRIGKVSTDGYRALAVFFAGVAALSTWLSVLFSKIKPANHRHKTTKRKKFARMKTLTASEAAKAAVAGNTPGSNGEEGGGGREAYFVSRKLEGF